jgi:hypothetical protein
VWGQNTLVDEGWLAGVDTVIGEDTFVVLSVTLCFEVSRQLLCLSLVEAEREFAMRSKRESRLLCWEDLHELLCPSLEEAEREFATRS